MNNFTKEFNQLNHEQKLAVSTIEGPVMVIAGPGTGKTQVLTLRVAKILLETHISPENILCLTFTEAGVKAMKQRLVSIIGPTAYQIKITTIHSFCNEIIEQNNELFNSINLRIIDDIESFQSITSITKKLPIESPFRKNIDNPHFFTPKILSAISILKNENITPTRLKKILNDLQELQTQLSTKLNSFINFKGQPKPEQITETQQILKTINLQPQNHYFNFLNDLKKPFEEYEIISNISKNNPKKLGTQRTKLKNNLKKTIEKITNNLQKQIDLQFIYENYQNYLIENSLYDYNDMITWVINKFEQNQNLLQHYQEIYQYILVDEFQDTNTGQNRVVNLLSSFFDVPNLFVVGDDDQGIYRFQGATITNLLEFKNQFSNNLTQITLTKNYRSQQNILIQANELISNNTDRLPKPTLISGKSLPKQKIQLNKFLLESTELNHIIKTIKNLLNSGTKASEIAIIYRNNQDSEKITQLLCHHKIPYSLRRGENIFESPIINQLITLLHAIDSPLDNHKFYDSLFLDIANQNPTEIIKLLSFYNKNHKNSQKIFEFCSEIENLTNLKTSKTINNFTQKIAHWHKLSKTNQLLIFLHELINESNLIQYALNSNTKILNLTHLKTFLTEAANQNKKKQNLTLKEFLNQINLRKEFNLQLLSNLPISTNQSIQLLTAHSSKGLEFEHVFLINCTENSWKLKQKPDLVPLPPSLINKHLIQNSEIIEQDERRLFYVALTRAKLQTYISYSETINQNGKIKNTLPCKFISELTPELLEINEYFEVPETEHIEYLKINLTNSKITEIFKENELIKSLVKNIKLSSSAINNYLECPRKFLIYNLIEYPSPQSKSSILGQSIHKSIDKFYKKINKTKTVPTVEVLINFYKENLNRNNLESNDSQELFERGKEILTRFYQQKSLSFKKESLTEFSFKEEINLNGIPLKGFIDKIDYLNQSKNLVRLTDFKTTSPEKNKSKLKPNGKYWLQLGFYQLLTELSQNTKLKVAETAIEYLMPNKNTEILETESIIFTPQDIETIKNIITTTYQQITSLNFNKLESKGSPCKNCTFKNICWEN